MSYTNDLELVRRTKPRVVLETLCSEYVADRERFSMIVDLSESGLRLQRPLRGGLVERVVQLEFGLPGTDEIIWAKGEICFDQLWRVPPKPDGNGLAGPLRTSGVRLTAARAH